MLLLRNALALICGFIAGSLVNMALVSLGSHVVPPPAGVNATDAASLAASIHLLQPQHYLFPFLGHALGTLVGAMTAYFMVGSRRAVFAWIVGVLFLAGGIAACSMIPAPAWFIALDLIGAYLPMAWLATRLAPKLRRTE